jgi:hypothetical protein
MTPPPLAALAALAALVIVAAFLLYRKKKADKANQPVETTGNNGSAPCSVFCATNWAQQLPASWTGATAVSQRLIPDRAGDVATDPKFQPTSDSAALTTSADRDVACTCGPSTTPWLTGTQVPDPWAATLDKSLTTCGSDANITQGVACGAKCPIAGLC